ncbi:hypothetical protein PM082_017729 [Marasmius tenuissimus]|nr:hypothetical protein PM082_017729 [Marasmius tenuissimus]
MLWGGSVFPALQRSKVDCRRQGLLMLLKEGGKKKGGSAAELELLVLADGDIKSFWTQQMLRLDQGIGATMSGEMRGGRLSEHQHQKGRSLTLYIGIHKSRNSTSYPGIQLIGTIK